MAQQEPVRAAEALVALERAHEALEVAKGAALDVARGGKEVLRGLELALAPLLPQARHPVRRGPEEEEVLLAHALPDLHVGTVQRANEQAAVHLELHVARAGGFRAGGGDVLAQLRGRDELLGQGDVVVGHEVDPHQVFHVGVVVDDLANAVGQVDALLGSPVAVEGLAAYDRDARHLLGALRGAHGLVLAVAVNDAEEVEELALVLVHALDLDVEHPVTHVADGRPLDGVLHHGVDEALEDDLPRRLGRMPLRVHRSVLRIFLQALQQRSFLDPLVTAEALGDDRCQLRVAEGKPAPWSNAIGLVLELLRPELVEVQENGVLAELAVQRGHTVHGEAANDAKVGHADTRLGVLGLHVGPVALVRQQGEALGLPVVVLHDRHVVQGVLQ
mmetsp:Transcript_9191/g.25696  ORF Transcript_9191/g.25696 Transcript_9191/m.25696 type:complete len:389 (-) Transcript_9191:1423-2589(-)